MIDPIIRLQSARTQSCKWLTELSTILEEIYEQFPCLLPKRPGEMSVADKLRFSEDLIKFIEVRDQYKP